MLLKTTQMVNLIFPKTTGDGVEEGGGQGGTLLWGKVWAALVVTLQIILCSVGRFFSGFRKRSSERLRTWCRPVRTAVRRFFRVRTAFRRSSKMRFFLPIRTAFRRCYHSLLRPIRSAPVLAWMVPTILLWAPILWRPLEIFFYTTIPRLRGYWSKNARVRLDRGIIDGRDVQAVVLLWLVVWADAGVSTLRDTAGFVRGATGVGEDEVGVFGKTAPDTKKLPAGESCAECCCPGSREKNTRSHITRAPGQEQHSV